MPAVWKSPVAMALVLAGADNRAGVFRAMTWNLLSWASRKHRILVNVVVLAGENVTILAFISGGWVVLIHSKMVICTSTD